MANDYIESEPIPNPIEDWLDQGELAAVLGVCAKTASFWAKDGRLAAYEHGFPYCGRRKYSRTLVERDRQRCWESAVRRQDAAPT